MERKAGDYSGDEDCNRNIRACEVMGICSVKQGIQVRMFDKLQRLISLTTRKAQVTDESVRDTLHDLRNYAAIYIHILEEENGDKAKPTARPSAVGS
jgi:hypothetical protein